MIEIRTIIDPNITKKLPKEQLELRNKILNNSFKMAFGNEDKKIVNDFLRRAQNRDLKATYNHLLKRYYNGCNYIEEHINEIDKYLPKVLELLDKLNKILEKIPNATKEEILNGFKT